MLLLATGLWAADFWIAKPYTDWTDKDIQKMPGDSPWAAKVTVAGGGGGIPGGGGPSGGGGGRGSRGGGGGGGGDNTDSGDTGGGGGGGGSRGGGGGGAGAAGGGGGGGAPAGADVTLAWETALPIKQALMKRKFGAEVGSSPDAKAVIDAKDEFYMLTMVGLPGNLAQAAQGDKKAALLALTTIEVKGK